MTKTLRDYQLSAVETLFDYYSEGNTGNPLIVAPVGAGKSLIIAEIIKRMGKGRDKELIKLRDEALCRRYYYWTEIQRLRFDDALKVLSEREFFISEERIMTIIRRKSREGTDYNLKPVPKVKAPRLTAAQLELFPVR